MAFYPPIVQSSKDVAIALTVRYCLGEVSNADLITLRAWLGLYDPIAPNDRRLHAPLVQKLVEIKHSQYSSAYIMEISIMTDEFMRIYSLLDQKIILAQIERIIHNRTR